jgi:hypothetical protein
VHVNGDIRCGDFESLLVVEHGAPDAEPYSVDPDKLGQTAATHHKHNPPINWLVLDNGENWNGVASFTFADSGKGLADAIDWCLSVCESNSHYAMNGVAFYPQGIVGTNGKALHLSTNAASAEELSKDPVCVIPRFYAECLARLVKNSVQNAINVYHNAKSNIRVARFSGRFIGGQCWSYLVTIECGRYPNVRDVMQKMICGEKSKTVKMDAAKVKAIKESLKNARDVYTFACKLDGKMSYYACMNQEKQPDIGLSVSVDVALFERVLSGFGACEAWLSNESCLVLSNEKRVALLMGLNRD